MANDKQEKSAYIFQDFANAFDKVKHKILYVGLL